MNESNNPTNPFKIVQIIYGSFMFGVLAFLLFTYFSIDNPVYLLDMDDIFTFIVPLLALSGVFISPILFASMIRKIEPADILQTKIAKYQSATIVKGAMLEAPALLAVVATFLSNNITFLLIAALLLIIMYLRFPSPKKFESEVVLSMEEKSKINKL